MKKYLLTGLLFFSISVAYSQHRIGLKFSPTLSFNRIDNDDNTVDYSSNGLGVRFILGPTFDYFLGENYYISTGLLYATKRAGVSGIIQANSPSPFPNRRVDEIYNIQYLQIPATLKLFTNELALDTRMYFQLGGLAEVKIADKIVQEDVRLIDRIRPFDFSVLLGTGIEYRIGVNTVLYGGISYNRGLLNIATKFNDANTSVGFSPFTLKNDLLAIDVGIMF